MARFVSKADSVNIRLQQKKRWNIRYDLSFIQKNKKPAEVEICHFKVMNKMIDNLYKNKGTNSYKLKFWLPLGLCFPIKHGYNTGHKYDMTWT